MRWKESSRKLTLGFALLLGAAFGAPMRPEQIEDLLNDSRMAKIVQVVKEEDKDKESD
ncbi:MAG: hypothetical protein ABI972_00735 [Acidobacteriota bacterium]